MSAIFCHSVPVEQGDEEAMGDYYKQRISELEELQLIDRDGEQTMKQKKMKEKEKLPFISCNFKDLKIKPVETNKNKIVQRHMMKENIIGRFPSVQILCGGIGSGKTTFLHNLLTRPEFYGMSYECVEDGQKPKKYFDEIFLFTGSDDDMYDQLIADKILKEEHVKFAPTPSDIQLVIDTQMRGIKKNGLENSPKVLIILEDLVDDLKLMRSKAMRSLFIRPRQMNMMVFMMAQYLRFIPSGLRRQAMNLFIFGGDRKSTEIICDEFCPSHIKQQEFMRLIEQAQEKREGDEYPFLHINKRVAVPQRFRRNLDKIIIIYNGQCIKATLL
jgi:hypothetical protein